MRFLSVFSGIGLHDYGLQQAGIEIAGQCEIDDFCDAVLEKHWPGLPRWRDIRDVTAESIRERCGRIDGITGGFPCQDLSVAGKGKGIGTEAEPTQKSGLWWELYRIVREVRPTWLLLENVPALRTRGADTVLAGLEQEGYTVRPTVVGAWAAGAPHRRDRVWIVGHLVNAARERLAGRDAPITRRNSDGVQATIAGSGAGHADELADASTGGAGPEVAMPAGRGGNRWPARPGEPQHDWEYPRLADAADRPTRRGEQQPEDGAAQGNSPRSHDTPPEPEMGGPTPGLSRELVDAVAAHFDKTAAEAEAWWERNKFRLQNFARRQELKALGNANPWIVPYLIGKWIRSQDDEAEVVAEPPK
jgi:site-specific DNA-cytosine methylase